MLALVILAASHFWTHRVPFGLIGSALVAVAVSDGTYAYVNTTGHHATGNVVDTGWVLGFLLLALAAFSPADARSRREDRRRARLARLAAVPDGAALRRLHPGAHDQGHRVARLPAVERDRVVPRGHGAPDRRAPREPRAHARTRANGRAIEPPELRGSEERLQTDDPARLRRRECRQSLRTVPVRELVGS